MHYQIRRDPVNGQRLMTACLLFAAAMLAVGGSTAWVIVSGKEEPDGAPAGQFSTDRSVLGPRNPDGRRARADQRPGETCGEGWPQSW